MSDSLPLADEGLWQAKQKQIL